MSKQKVKLAFLGYERAGDGDVIDFGMKGLVEKHGSWIRVQVAFYDFLFETASELCATCFRETALAEIAQGGFADGEDVYETTMARLEEIFATAESAWLDFLEQELSS